MASLSNLMKQMATKPTSDPMDEIFLTFNSMVAVTNRDYWQVDDWTRLTFRQALLMYQANFYCERFKLNDNDYHHPQEVIDDCVNRGLIGSDVFEFPKMNRKPNHGAVWQFSDFQKNHIRDEEEWRETPQGIERDRMFSLCSGGVRSGKTQANAFKLANMFAKPEMNGNRHAIFGYTYSVIQRIALQGNGTLLEILPHATVSRMDSESQKLIVPSLVYPFTDTSEVFLIPINSKKAYGNILGLSLNVVWLMELGQLLNYADIVGEVVNRTLASKTPYLLSDCNPFINPAINKLVKMFSGSDEIERSQRFYKYSHWSIVNGTNPSITPTMLQEIILSYSSDPYLLRSKVYGEWLKPSGTILNAFSREKNVVGELPTDIINPSLYFVIDEGYSDANIVSCWLSYHSTDTMQQEALLVAEAYHKVDVKTTIPRQSVGVMTPSQFTTAILEFAEQATRKLQRYYGKLMQVQMIIDPSCKGLKNELDMILSAGSIPYTLLKNFGVYPRNADNGSKLSRKIGREEAIEEQYRRLNKMFETRRFKILNSDMFGLLDDGTPAYSTEPNIQECETFVRIKGKIPTTGQGDKETLGHGDAVVCNRYFVNEFRRDRDRDI